MLNAFKIRAYDAVVTELNAFNHPPATFGATAVGLVAIGCAFVVDAGGATFVALSWLLVIGGVALTLGPSRLSPLGPGFVVAGAAIPVAVFCWLWVTYSGLALLA